MLDQAGADAVLDIVAAAVLDDDGFDAGEMQQMRQHRPGGPGSDDADLGAHRENIPGGSGGLYRGAPAPRQRDEARKFWPRCPGSDRDGKLLYTWGSPACCAPSPSPERPSCSKAAATSRTRSSSSSRMTAVPSIGITTT